MAPVTGATPRAASVLSLSGRPTLVVRSRGHIDGGRVAGAEPAQAGSGPAPRPPTRIPRVPEPARPLLSFHGDVGGHPDHPPLRGLPAGVQATAPLPRGARPRGPDRQPEHAPPPLSGDGPGHLRALARREAARPRPALDGHRPGLPRGRAGAEAAPPRHPDRAGRDLGELLRERDHPAALRGHGDAGLRHARAHEPPPRDARRGSRSVGRPQPPLEDAPGPGARRRLLLPASIHGVRHRLVRLGGGRDGLAAPDPGAPLEPEHRVRPFLRMVRWVARGVPADLRPGSRARPEADRGGGLRVPVREGHEGRGQVPRLLDRDLQRDQ